MKSLLKILIINLFLIFECFAQGIMTMQTDKNDYSYGDSIKVSVTISNNTDTTFSLWGTSCMVYITFDNVKLQMICDNVVSEYKFEPGSSRTWTWELVPSILGIPTQNGKQVIYGYCHGSGSKDSIIITEPRYYGGLLEVIYKLGTPYNKIQKIRDSLKAVIYHIDTLKSIGSVEEIWQIKNYSIDSLANIYSNDSLFQVFQVERSLEFPKEIITSVKQVTATSKKYMLYQNYPNPFNPSTMIKYSVPQESYVTLEIYDVLGRELETIVDEEKAPGNYKVKFNGEKYPSGIYLCVMHAKNYLETEKLILIK